jgi:hypothetical protein
MGKTIRRVWLRLALSAELVSAALGVAAPHAHPILTMGGTNHCEPVIRDQ